MALSTTFLTPESTPSVINSSITAIFFLPFGIFFGVKKSGSVVISFLSSPEIIDITLSVSLILDDKTPMVSVLLAIAITP